MNADMRVVNCLRECRLGMRIDLDRLYQHMNRGKLYRGRPQMLVLPMSCGRNLQVFVSGVIQIMGHVTHRVALGMRDEFLYHLRQLYPQLPTPTVTLKNLVVCAQLKRSISLHRLSHSSAKTIYEPELFPALLLRQFQPVHVAVFHTGRCVLTGLRSLDQARDIMSELNAYLNTIL